MPAHTIQDEFTHIPSASKRYALRHPERIKRKNSKYLQSARGRYIRHQRYLRTGTHYESAKFALKQIVKRYLATEYLDIKSWAYDNSFDNNPIIKDKVVLLSDLEEYLRERKDYHDKSSHYKYFE